MTIEDYVISVLLIAVVLRQLRGRRLTTMGLLWPIGLVVYFAVAYTHPVVAAGHNVLFVWALAVWGVGFGILAGIFTQVYRNDQPQIIAKATAWAAVFWVSGMSVRIIFGLYAANGGGQGIARLSARLQITDANTWATALIFMALAEVVARTAVLGVKGYRLHRS